MTIVFSIIHPLLITLAVDRAVTRVFNEGEFTEYDTGRKAYHYPGVGVVATWGARDGNNIGSFLEQQKIEASTHNVDTLADLVFHYLKEDYCPHERGADDVGYHIAGFDINHRPRLYHILYGFDRPRREEQIEREYKRLDHSPVEPNQLQFLYNGRNDLAEPMIRLFMAQLMQGFATRFNLSKLEDIVLLSDFIIRFSAEITPEVGPPFRTFLIAPDNQISSFTNDELRPVQRDDVSNLIVRLGYRQQTT
jgi:hypothetical protein